MVTETTRRRAHIVMPDDVIEAIDAMVGPRKRSQFVQEAVEEKLHRGRLKAAFTQFAGAFAGADHPGWETREAAAEWVHNLRYHPEKVTLPNGNRDE